MQSINIVVLNPVFLGAFIGTAALCVLLIVSSLFRWHAPGALYLLVGGALYVVGTFMMTRVCNIPKNDALAAVTPADPESASLWASYLVTWTAWNHVRTGAALAAAASLTVALCY